MPPAGSEPHHAPTPPAGPEPHHHPAPPADPGPGYGRFDLWRDSAGADGTQVRELAALLELRARDPEQVAARAAYLELAGVVAGSRVLDVGCGSGAVARAAARLVGPTGRVVGLDPSPGLLAVASELVERDGLAGSVELRVGQAQALPFPDGAFDVVLAVTTLAHLPQAEQAIPELVRVARPGGRVGVFDLDGDGVILAHPDRALTAGSSPPPPRPWSATRPLRGPDGGAAGGRGPAGRGDHRGRAACLAGHAAGRAGGRPVPRRPDPPVRLGHPPAGPRGLGSHAGRA
jgi:SAM-dependent methyltransferase